jgi:hypothetical protein
LQSTKSLVARQSELYSKTLNDSTTEPLEPENILFLYKRKIDDDLYETKYFKVPYFIEFLQIRGHDLEEAIFDKELTQVISKQIYHSGLQFIPLDLAQVFFELSEKVRQNLMRIVRLPERLPQHSPEDFGVFHLIRLSRELKHEVGDLERLSNAASHDSDKYKLLSENLERKKSQLVKTNKIFLEQSYLYLEELNSKLKKIQTADEVGNEETKGGR